MFELTKFLDGKKTTIAGWVTASAPLLLLLGYNIGPEEVNLFINNWFEWMAVGWTGMGVVIAYFRNLSKKK